MVALTYGISSYTRRRGDLPELPVINMFSEVGPTEDGVILQSRPGLTSSSITMGDGPVRALYRIDGVLNNGLFGVSGSKLYHEDVEIGQVEGEGPASLAGYEDRIFVNSGGPLYTYDGTDFLTISLPENFLASKVVTGASRAIVIRKDSGRFYWSDILTSSIDDLSFATAENSPDKLKDMLFIGDTLILFGSETVEFWASSPDPDLPFQATPGRTYQTGIRATGCATQYLDTWAWITDKNVVCVATPTQVISDPDIESRIGDSEIASLWTFEIDGTDFLALRLDDQTWVYHSRNQTWSQFESYGQTNWLPQCYEKGYFGLSNSGTLAQWSNDYYDFGSVLERRFRAGMAINGGTEMVANVMIRTNPGQTRVLSGQYSDPIISLRYARDGGFQWSSWREKRLGVQGSYDTRSVWTSLGYFAYPGGLFEFRVTDPVPFRVSGAYANEEYGGI